MGVMGSPGEIPSFGTPKRATALVYIVTSLEASPWRACLYPLHVLLLFCGWWMPGRRSRVVRRGGGLGKLCDGDPMRKGCSSAWSSGNLGLHE